MRVPRGPALYCWFVGGLSIMQPSPLLLIRQEDCSSCCPAPRHWLVEGAGICDRQPSQPIIREECKGSHILAAPLWTRGSPPIPSLHSQLGGWATTAMKISGSHWGASMLCLVRLFNFILQILQTLSNFTDNAQFCSFRETVNWVGPYYIHIPLVLYYWNLCQLFPYFIWNWCQASGSIVISVILLALSEYYHNFSSLSVFCNHSIPRFSKRYTSIGQMSIQSILFGLLDTSYQGFLILICLSLADVF